MLYGMVLCTHTHTYTHTLSLSLCLTLSFCSFSASPVLAKLRECGFADSTNALLRKLNTKLVQVHHSKFSSLSLSLSLSLSSSSPDTTQRLGTTFLPAQIASWRYQRGSRSLEQTLAALTVPREKVAVTVPQEEDDYGVPEEIEVVIEVLLQALADRDSTVVRWSAAKG